MLGIAGKIFEGHSIDAADADAAEFHGRIGTEPAHAGSEEQKVRKARVKLDFARITRAILEHEGMAVCDGLRAQLPVFRFGKSDARSKQRFQRASAQLDAFRADFEIESA